MIFFERSHEDFMKKRFKTIIFLKSFYLKDFTTKTCEDLKKIFTLMRSREDLLFFSSLVIFFIKSSWDLSKKIITFLINNEISWRSSLNIFVRSHFSDDLQLRSASYLQKDLIIFLRKILPLGTVPRIVQNLKKRN